MTRTRLSLLLAWGLSLALLGLLIGAPGAGQAPAPSPLAARGYAALPEPRRASLRGPDIALGPDWRIETSPSVQPNDIALVSLREELSERFGLRLGARGPGGVVRLTIQPGSVQIGDSLDRDKTAVAEQAYRLELAPREIAIAANAPTGLFYGVQTLVQLVKKASGRLLVPEGEIVDWPDLHLRFIYWDDAHHLDRMETLKRALRQAAFFKINGLAIKLEGHFQYASAPALVEPYALSPAELQELTDYGLRYHIQLIPYLDGPAHIAFILKHPEYAPLREYPENNYELCAINPDSYKLMLGMYQDLLAANRGVDYFYLSTDEAYYIGKGQDPACNEAARAQALGSVGKLLAEFLDKTAGYLQNQGRTVIFWGEFPLTPADIPALPAYLVNGETYGPAFDAAFRARGIREMVYVSTQGEERMFPDYYLLPAEGKVHGGRGGSPRVPDAARKIATDSARVNGDVIGAVTAAWADAGLHTETFWLGYAAIPAAAWNPASDPRASMAAFYPLFYGPSAVRMDRLYELLSQQAQFWADSWESGPSKARKPILGNSRGIFDAPHPATDQSLPLPPPPAGADLSYPSTWARANAKRVALAGDSSRANAELLGLLDQNMRLAEFNHYSLEVFRSIARLFGQNLDMLAALGKIDALFGSAQKLAQDRRPKQAVAAIDSALGLARAIRAERNAALAGAEAAWYESWRPRVAEANGRRFLHELDDIKDHLPDRTVDLSYLVYRELELPMDDWFEKVEAARNQYAAANHLPPRRDTLAWKQTAIR